MIRFLLGGERSGKSACAESLFMEDPGPRLVVATGSPVDMAFRAQIQRHKKARPSHIPVRECSVNLGRTLAEALEEHPSMSILVDSLDFWYFHCCNQAAALHDPLLPQAALDDMVLALGRAGQARITLVSCEIGLGPVPANRETREFVRGLGGIHHQIASLADTVLFLVAGCPLTIKG